MILGMSTATYTFLHVLISLVGIGSGLALMFVFITGKRLDSLACGLSNHNGVDEHHRVWFSLRSPFAVSQTWGHLASGAGNCNPCAYVFHLVGSSRWIYVVGASMALYLNVFVLLAQLFMKVPALKALAPTQSEPPFLVAQLLVLLIFVGLAILAAKRFHLQPARA